eukprot:Pompholyxophrys_punicea_v1_NODE_25_length_5265_cov_107.938388.p3 type:complete len:260 gc:universal NODE_25_length_5265_cov_107.938388:2133-2912(+)
MVTKPKTTTKSALSTLHRPYTYTVIRSDHIANAFVLPGNHVFVYTGLFRYVRDEDDLAAVLGHEIAHNLLRHPAERMSSAIWTNFLIPVIVLTFLDPTGIVLQLIAPLRTILSEFPHSRIQEMEADEIGIQLATIACYDPSAAKRVFEAMSNDEDDDENDHGGRKRRSSTSTSRPPEFLSTHPTHEHRIANFTTWIPRVLKKEFGNIDDGDDDHHRGEGKRRLERCKQIRQEMRRAREFAATATIADGRGLNRSIGGTK